MKKLLAHDQTQRLVSIESREFNNNLGKEPVEKKHRASN